MRTIKNISLIVMVIAVFFSIDLGINFAYSLVSELNDGIGNQCIVNIFGNSDWSRTAYLAAFQKSLGFTFVMFIENIVLTVILEKKRS